MNHIFVLSNFVWKSQKKNTAVRTYKETMPSLGLMWIFSSGMGRRQSQDAHTGSSPNRIHTHTLFYLLKNMFITFSKEMTSNL